VPFSDLRGWPDDHHSEAVPALLASCTHLAALPDNEPIGSAPFAGKAAEWRAACTAAARLRPGDDAAARHFFEQQFVPYAASDGQGGEGKFTGYSVHTLRCSRRRHDKYQYPILARPPDLVMVDLDRFLPDAKGRRIWGRVDAATGSLVLYPTRAEIRRGALGSRERALFWIDDPVDVLFAEIEGSGKVALDDGTVAWIGFAGKNGRGFRGVGSILRGLGEIAPGEGTMQRIHDWFRNHRQRTDEILDRSDSKVFFEEHPARGRLEETLMRGRSLAVDPGFIALGTPVWVDTHVPAGRNGQASWQHLVIAQDRGGGIRGPLRGDIYWGDDADAEAIASTMNDTGKLWLLLPRAVQVPETP
jgi:membrane-bound lytic murein transglycosylase A